MTVSKEQQEMLRQIEQAVSALVDNAKWVYMVVVLPREITEEPVWSHGSNSPFMDLAPFVSAAIMTEYTRRLNEGN